MIVERILHPDPSGHPLARAWREDPARFAALLPFTPDVAGARAAAARALRPSGPFDSVVETLVRENAARGHDRAAALGERLRRGAVVVVTGQQPGLFGGPLLTFEKIAGAVRAAARLRDAGVPDAVAVFWSQSEDHDLEEVNRLEVLRDGSVTRLRAPIPDEGRRFSDTAIGDDVVAFARGAIEEARPVENPDDALAPRAGEPFPEWTLRLVLRVFAEDELLVADPAWLRAAAGGVVARAISEHAAWTAALQADTDRVRALGFEPQVTVDGSGGLFLVDSDRRRRRLRAGGDGRFRSDDGPSWTRDELLGLVATEPDRFSPNVQVRPLVQQALLPVAVQVCGPAEAAYFAQFRSLFAAAGMPLPAVIARPTSTILGPKQAKRREALGLDAATLLGDPAEWPDGAAPAAHAAAFSAAERLEAEGVAALRDAADHDALRRAVAAYAEKAAQARAKLLDVFRRDAEARADAAGGRRRALAEWVRPRGRPQERVFGLLAPLAFASFAAIRRWLGTLDPFEREHVICTFEEGDRIP